MDIIYTKNNGTMGVWMRANWLEPVEVSIANMPKIEIFENGRVVGFETVADPVAIKPGIIAQKDKTFRNAWRKSGSNIVTDMPHAKQLAHGYRRALRDKLMGPLDKLSVSPVVAIKNKANADKQKIYEDNALLQIAIDAENTEEGLLSVLRGAGA